MTITEARDDVFTLFKTAWDANGGGAGLYYQDRPTDPPETGPWGFIQMEHVDGGQRSIGPTAIFERVALVTVQIWCEAGQGMTQSDTLAQVVLDAFEGEKTANGVWFRNARVGESGRDGEWYVTNVFVEASYDEVK